MTESADPTATESPAPAWAAKHWSDRKADTVAVLVIFTAMVLAAVHFISGGLTS